MKNNARLYLPWPLVSAFVSSDVCRPPEARPDGRKHPLRYIAFQMAEVAVPRQMFQEILRLIAELRPQPPPRWLMGRTGLEGKASESRISPHNVGHSGVAINTRL
jgi:hypothetical protein